MRLFGFPFLIYPHISLIISFVLLVHLIFLLSYMASHLLVFSLVWTRCEGVGKDEKSKKRGKAGTKRTRCKHEIKHFSYEDYNAPLQVAG